ncbi:putative RNA-binding protein eif1ad [Rhizophlyctis rosea]|nr:putative RNA-binding protein eif1ad [Rhizophlyctis rosea]
MGRKQTARQVLTELPVPTETQQVAKVLETRGGGLYEVEYYDSPAGRDPQKCLVSLPSKFRKLIWVKRGSYVIFEVLEAKTKIAGEIVHVLFPEHIKNLRNQGLWPTQFDTQAEEEATINSSQSASEESDDNDDLLMANPNHRTFSDDESEGDGA